MVKTSEVQAKMGLYLPEQVKEVAHLFYRHGYTFWLVGGFVRDVLMDRKNVDIDATTDARPEHIKDVLRHSKYIRALYDVGEKYGTVAVKLTGDVTLEITTYRTEQYIAGSRLPEVMFGTSLEADLDRRDFTINSIAWALPDGPLVDFHGGIQDMRYRVVRAVDDPYKRFAEDPLRMLRAARFAAQLDYTIDNNTQSAMYYLSERILSISQERIRDELIKLLLSDSPSRGLLYLWDTKLLEYILPEVARLNEIEQRGPHHNKNAFWHTLGVVNNIPSDVSLRLSALLHDTGKYQTHQELVQEEYGPVDTFYGHESVSASTAIGVLRRLRFPTEIVLRVAHLCRLHMRPLQMYNNWPPSNKAIRRFIRDCNAFGATYKDVLELNKADVLGHTNQDLTQWVELVDMCHKVDITTNVATIESPLDGDELMAVFGFGPGRHVGELKQVLLDAVVDGDIPENDKEAAWNLARQWVDTNYRS